MENKPIKISLNTIPKVKEFSNIMARQIPDCDLIAESNRYIIDAKSIMGIFSLDLSKNLNLVIHSENQDEYDAVVEAVKAFIV